jgi:hypothetical protein
MNAEQRDPLETAVLDRKKRAVGYAEQPGPGFTSPVESARSPAALARTDEGEERTAGEAIPPPLGRVRFTVPGLGEERGEAGELEGRGAAS